MARKTCIHCAAQMRARIPSLEAALGNKSDLQVQYAAKILVLRLENARSLVIIETLILPTVRDARSERQAPAPAAQKRKERTPPQDSLSRNDGGPSKARGSACGIRLDADHGVSQGVPRGRKIQARAACNVASTLPGPGKWKPRFVGLRHGKARFSHAKEHLRRQPGLGGHQR